MMERIKTWIRRRKMMDVQTFAHSHRNYLVIVCDPKDETIFVSFLDKQVCGRISSEDGRDHEVIKQMLEHSVFEDQVRKELERSTFDEQIDRFLGALIMALRIPLKVGNVFYSFIDGALFNISKALKK